MKINEVNIKITELRKLKNECLAYFNDDKYIIWSNSKKKYIIATNNISFKLCSCPTCKNGELRVVRSHTTSKRFIGCSNYRNGCNTSSPLIQKASIRFTQNRCKLCLWPICFFRYTKKQKWNKQCTNIKCIKNLSNSYHIRQGVYV
ncbi:MAG: DNA topoisomerase [Thaumarchaeota archaeon]|nr:DNA topoisomerase [Nitrososphaerota archaeon]